MKFLLLLLISLSFSFTSFADEIHFLWGTEIVMKVPLETMKSRSLTVNGKSINTVKEVVYNPFRKYTKSYEGYEFIALLDQIYGKGWREADSITFTAMDGFIQTSPIKKMIEKSKEHTGILSFKEVDSHGFTAFTKKGKEINPGPFYLVWNRFDGRSVANYSDYLKWPYQLKSIKVLKIKK